MYYFLTRDLEHRYCILLETKDGIASSAWRESYAEAYKVLTVHPYTVNSVDRVISANSDQNCKIIHKTKDIESYPELII